MQHHTHAPPGAPAGQAVPSRLLEADWSKGIPPGYLAVLERLKQLRGEYEEQIAAAIDGLDILDMAIADLEPEEDANDEDIGGEPSLGAPEAVTCSDAAVAPVRRRRKSVNLRGSDQAANLPVDRSCDQSDWGRGDGLHFGTDAEIDTSDDEPSLGAVERHPVVGFYAGLVIDPRASQEMWAGQGWTGGGDTSDREEENEHGSDLDAGEADDSDREPSLGSVGAGSPSTMSQTAWGVGAQDDREEENEHGGDINDEPQDGEEDYEDELDGSFDDDMEPGGDIAGGTYRGGFRPSIDLVGDSDIGPGR